MMRNVGDDDVLSEQKGALDQQRGLVVKNLLPPARRKELGQDDGHHVVGSQPLERVDVFGQRSQQ